MVNASSHLELFAELEAELESILSPQYESEWEAEFSSTLKKWGRKAANTLRAAALAGTIATAPLLPPKVHQQLVDIVQVVTGTRDPNDEKNRPRPLPSKPVAGGSAPPPSRKRKQRELEAEFEAITQRVSPTALMESLGYAATTAESESEAIAVIQNLPALTARLYPQAAKLIKTASPTLKKGLNVATRSLYQNPQTRPLVQILPTVLRHTLTTLNRQQQAGTAITPNTVSKQFIHQTHRVLGHPQQVHQTLQRSKATLRRTAAPTSQVRSNGVSIQSIF